MSINHLSVAKRLSIGFGVLLLFLVLVAGLGMRGLQQVEQSLLHISNINIVKIELLYGMSESSDAVTRVMRTIALLHDDAEIDRQLVKIVDARTAYNQAFEALQSMPISDAGKVLV